MRIFVRGNITRYSDFAIHSAEAQDHDNSGSYSIEQARSSAAETPRTVLTE